MAAGGQTRPVVVIVGSVNVDLVVAAERLPGRGETVLGRRLERYGGGKGGTRRWPRLGSAPTSASSPPSATTGWPRRRSRSCTRRASTSRG